MNPDNNKVAAFYVDERIVCAGCTTDKDWSPLKQGNVITRKEVEENDKIFFCDICGEAI